MPHQSTSYHRPHQHLQGLAFLRHPHFPRQDAAPGHARLEAVRPAICKAQRRPACPPYPAGNCMNPSCERSRVQVFRSVQRWWDRGNRYFLIIFNNMFKFDAWKPNLPSALIHCCCHELQLALRSHSMQSHNLLIPFVSVCMPSILSCNYKLELFSSFLSFVVVSVYERSRLCPVLQAPVFFSVFYYSNELCAVGELQTSQVCRELKLAPQDFTPLRGFNHSVASHGNSVNDTWHLLALALRSLQLLSVGLLNRMTCDLFGLAFDKPQVFPSP